MKRNIIKIKHNEIKCPKCGARDTWFTGGKIMIATGNMTPYLYFCTNCKHEWGENPLY